MIKVQVAKSVTPAIPGLTDKDKVLYYLIIGEGDDKVIINVGEKTYTKVKQLPGLLHTAINPDLQDTDTSKKETENKKEIPDREYKKIELETAPIKKIK